MPIVVIMFGFVEALTDVVVPFITEDSVLVEVLGISDGTVVLPEDKLLELWVKFFVDGLLVLKVLTFAGFCVVDEEKFAELEAMLAVNNPVDVEGFVAVVTDFSVVRCCSVDMDATETFCVEGAVGVKGIEFLVEFTAVVDEPEAFAVDGEVVV